MAFGRLTPLRTPDTEQIDRFVSEKDRFFRDDGSVDCGDGAQDDEIVVVPKCLVPEMIAVVVVLDPLTAGH